MEPNLDTIPLEYFQKIDLKVGTVLAAKPHPNADKLMCLSVDIGKKDEKGIVLVPIVAGIKRNYTSEQMIGRMVIVVTNLPPANLRGEVSEGMLLAAKDETGQLSLLMPDKILAPGSKVS